MKDKTKLVYSTDANLRQQIKNEKVKDINLRVNNLPPDKQELNISLQTRGRRGKKVTVIQGFKHDHDTLIKLSRELKQSCGAGGTVKEYEIEIQGDKRKQVTEKLTALGYRV